MSWSLFCLKNKGSEGKGGGLPAVGGFSSSATVSLYASSCLWVPILHQAAHTLLVPLASLPFLAPWLSLLLPSEDCKRAGIASKLKIDPSYGAPTKPSEAGCGGSTLLVAA